MTVYKYFNKITWNNRWVILIYIILFFFIVAVNSSGANEGDTSFIETRLKVGIIDNENSQLSKGLIEYIESKNDIVDTQEDESYIKEQIFMETVDAVIIIPDRFDEKVKDKEESVIVYTDDRKPQSLQIENQVNKFLSFANITYENGEYNLADVKTALSEAIDVSILDSQEEANSGITKWVNVYFNMTGYAIIAIYISAIGLVMSDLNDDNIVMRRRISSKRFLKYNTEIFLGQLTIAILTTLIFILGFVVWKGEFIELVYFPKYIINIIVFSISILCLTFLITNITRNKYAITALSTVLSLGTSFISGVMVPQEILSENVLNIAKFFPTYYFVRANDMTINSLLDIRYEILMQLLFALAFLLLGLIFSKKSQKV